MPIQISGGSQSPQESDTLDKLTRQAGRFAGQARNVTDQIDDFLRKHKASGFGTDIGAASGDEFLTSSGSSVTVSRYRKMLKAAVSYAVVIGEMSQSNADALLQGAYGNDSETTVPASEISSLTDQWI